MVFDDEILRAPIGLLGADERTDIEAKVRECCDREQWSKIVLVSRVSNYAATAETTEVVLRSVGRS